MKSYYNEEIAQPDVQKEFPSGKTYTAKFIESGPCGYKNFKVYVEPCCLPALAATLKGKPVVLGHVGDMTYNQMLKTAVGYVSKVYSNESGNVWYADFVVFKEEAINAISDRTAACVSCTYKPEYSETAEKRINGITYDRIVVGGEMLELALVKKPRYNDTDVWENADDDDSLVSGVNLVNEVKEEKMFFGIKKEKVDVPQDLLFNTDAGEKTLEEILVLVNEGEAAKAELEAAKAELESKTAELDKANADLEAAKADLEKAEKDLADAQEALAGKDPENVEGNDAELKQALANELEKDPEEIATVILSTIDGRKK